MTSTATNRRNDEGDADAEAYAGAIAQARQFVAQAERALAGQPSPHTLPLDVQRSLNASMASAPVAAAEDRAVNGVPVRVFVPDTVTGVYLHIHGGGWTMGSASFQDERLWRVATEAELAVVSVDYRLAPEHPFPAAADDCEAVARWLVEGSGREFGSGRLLIGGESAGAHLSVVTLLRLRDHDRVGLFRGANLAYGCYDLSMTPSQRRWGDRMLVLSTPIIEWHTNQLLPGLDAEQRRDPAISPLFADLRGLPPALLTVGDDDPLLDDSCFLAARWPSAELVVYEVGFHAFDLFPIRLGELATQRQIDFLRRM